jgi:F0F1-type ATP synthase gamma subunit
LIEYSHKFRQGQRRQTTGFIVVTDKGLCGSLNTNACGRNDAQAQEFANRRGKTQTLPLATSLSFMNPRRCQGCFA